MRRLMNFLAITVMGLFLTTQVGWAQHSGHHMGVKADTSRSANSGQMMPMHQQGMNGNTMMQSGNMSSQGMRGGMGMMEGGMHGNAMMGMNDPVIRTMHNYGAPGFLLMSATDLNLNETQIEKLKALNLDWKKTAVNINADIDVAQIELREALAATPPDFNTVKKTAAKIGAAEEELRTSYINIVVKARDLLTADQLVQLESLPGTPWMGHAGMTMRNN